MTTSPKKTSTLYHHGSVYSPTAPFAQAMLIDDDTVVWIGDDSAAAAHAADVDHVVNLDGALVTPAFVDAHVHTTSTGLALDGPDLTRTRSLTDALDLLGKHARARPGAIVLGHGWDETRWPERRPPTSADLDAATDGAVVYLSRVDVHSAVVSSALLAASPDLKGEPGWDDSGLVSRQAHHVARRVSRSLLPTAQRRSAQQVALREAARAGIGCVHELGGPDISSPDDFLEVLALGRAGDGVPEVLGYWGECGGIERARELGALGAAGDLFADGAIGSRTAALRTVYADADTNGYGYLTAAEVRDHVVACTEAGLQAGFHVIGDGAMDTVVAGFREAAGRVGVPALRAVRHRLEHAEMLDSTHIAALAELGVFASVQPAFDALWGGDKGMYAQRLGPVRALRLNPFADMAAAGIPLAFGSDSPVTRLDPWGTVRAAAFHHVPALRLSVRAAFTAHTRGGWRAAGRDDTGVLTPGAPATFGVWEAGDLVVHAPDERVAAWSTDPRAGVPGLPDLTPGRHLPTCLRTVVRGRVMYDVEGALA